MGNTWPLYAQSIFARSAKTGFTRTAAGSTLMPGKMYCARTPVYSIGRATERERERVAIATLCCAAPQLFRFTAATSTRRLSAFDACRRRTLRVFRCHLYRRAFYSFCFSRERVYRNFVRELTRCHFCHSAWINTDQAKCRKCLVSV